LIFIKSTVDEIIPVDLHQDGKTGTHGFPDIPGDLGYKSRSLLQIPPVLILPSIAQGRQKLAQEVAMGRMKLDGIETSLLGP
jgi:hypothetical protein